MILKEIIPLKQSLSMSCVATTITMVLQGFGVEISEQELLHSYFPITTIGDMEVGVLNSDMVRQLVKCIEDRQLNLRVDLFMPSLSAWLLYPGKNEGWIVQVKRTSPLEKEEIQRKQLQGQDSPEDESKGDWFPVLIELMTRGKIRVYTVNPRKVQEAGKLTWTVGDAPSEFLDAFDAFLAKGHVICKREGVAGHVCVLDATHLGQRQGTYHVVDPLGEALGYYAPFLPRAHFFQLIEGFESVSLRGSYFEDFIRVSLRDE